MASFARHRGENIPALVGPMNRTAHGAHGVAHAGPRCEHFQHNWRRLLPRRDDRKEPRLKNMTEKELLDAVCRIAMAGSLAGLVFLMVLHGLGIYLK